MKSPAVFLCATREDYSAAREVWRHLDDCGVESFFCDESLLRTGDPSYRGTVDRALATARCLVIVAGSGERLRQEWMRRLRARFDARDRAGSILALLCQGMKPGDLPRDLRAAALRWPCDMAFLRASLTTGATLRPLPPVDKEKPRRPRLITATAAVLLAGNLAVLIAILRLWPEWRAGMAGRASQDTDGEFAEGGSRHRAGLANGDGSGGNKPAAHSLVRAAAGEQAADAETDNAAGISDPQPHSDVGGELRAPPSSPQPGDTWRFDFAGATPLGFVWIPPGSFLIGSPDSEPGRKSSETQRKVTITKGFWLARTECTQSLWSSVMGHNPSANQSSPELPVENVPLTLVSKGHLSFLERLNESHAPERGWKFKLPTEAQWEYACRAGTTTPFSFSSALNGSQANCDGSIPYGTSLAGPFLRATTRVASYAANPWGLHDMHGNVWEWCADTWTETYRDDPDPVTGIGSRHVIRGGCWRFNAALCRSASHNSVDASTGDDATGFRIALVQEP